MLKEIDYWIKVSSDSNNDDSYGNILSNAFAIDSRDEHPDNDNSQEDQIKICAGINSQIDYL
jgi:hypothetical protein